MQNTLNLIESLESVRPREISCDIKGSATIFQGVTGVEFSVKCPANCDKEENPIFGNMIYEQNSAVCKAGIHSGHVGPEGGMLIFSFIFNI